MSAPEKRVRLATLMSVYRGDDPERFLAALESVLGQEGLEGCENRIYLAVDGPIPASLEDVIARYAPLIHSVVRRPVPSGLAAALNVLIGQLACEAFVFRMDADDVSMPGRYAAQLRFLDRHPDVDIVGTGVLEVDRKCGSRREVHFAKDPRHAVNAIGWRVPVAHPTVCFRRAALERACPYPDTRYVEDLALWINCMERGLRFSNLPEVLLEFTVSENFWRRRGATRAFAELKCYLDGVWRIHGPSWRLALPFIRFILRAMPVIVIRWSYGLPMRRMPADGGHVDILTWKGRTRAHGRAIDPE